MTYRILTQLLEMTSFTVKIMLDTWRTYYKKKICFRYLSKNFQYCTPDVYCKFVFCVLNVVTVSYLVCYLKVLLVAKIVERQ